MNEARLAARLNHPNIVQTNEVFEHHGLPVIVMEYLEGQAMSSVLSRARHAEVPAHTAARHLGRARRAPVLARSHRLRRHAAQRRAPRPSACTTSSCTFDGQVKPARFRHCRSSRGSHVETAAGVIKGKIRYMSPEQITGDNVDRRADLFAVGVMMWEAATGTRLAGIERGAVMNQLLNADVPKPSSVAEVDPALERIIVKALELDRTKRYGSAFELQGELDDYLATLGTQVRPRDIGKAVSSMFEDVRAQTRRVIEAQLSKVVPLSDRSTPRRSRSSSRASRSRTRRESDQRQAQRHAGPATQARAPRRPRAARGGHRGGVARCARPTRDLPTTRPRSALLRPRRRRSPSASPRSRVPPRSTSTVSSCRRTR